MKTEHVSRTLRARESAHRRGVLVAIGALLVFSMSPVFGHHVASRANALLTGRDHLFNVCLIALHLLLEPVHLVFHVLLVAGLLYAIVDRGRAVLGVRGITGLVQWTTPLPHDMVWNAAREAGLTADQVRVVTGLLNPAFTAGWWTPRVYVAAELANALSAEQLAVVLAHEAAHVRRRDPLRLSSLRFLACTVFYLPAMRRLADDVADEAEVCADDRALEGRDVRDATVLASAIVDIAMRWGQPWSRGEVAAGGGLVGFQRADLLERRVRRLLGQETAVGTHVTRRSIVGAAVALAAVWMSGLMMAHPLPADIETHGGSVSASAQAADRQMLHSSAHPEHCNHHGALAVTHLFCLGWHAHDAGSPCPHMLAAHRAGSSVA